MIDDKFIDSFIDDAEKVTLQCNNRYFVRCEKQYARYVTHPKVEWINNIWSEKFKNILNSITIQDRIFIHWYDLSIGKLMLTIDRNIPLYVAFWGGEFYEDPFLYHINWMYDPLTLKYVRRNYLYPQKWSRRPNRFIKQIWSVINYKKLIQPIFELKKQTIHRINYLLLSDIDSGQVDDIKNIYSVSELPYRGFLYNQNFDLANQLRNTSKKVSNTVVIQLGNSATESNNHVDCFKMLNKFKDNDIILTLPLSYGTPQYAEFVKERGIKYFGIKFNAMENFMSRTTYVQKLNKVDIGIMYHNRSQAFGNCITLLTLGKKLYLKRNNPLRQLFNKVGIIVFDAHTIKDLSFKEFSEPLSENEIKNNIDKISNLFSERKRLEYLTKLLN
jgi:dTDP-N-acetylfucosamine:lipid II N-acetylfucosaminyltransferase